MSGEEMPIWLPPTPPSDEKEEFFVDNVLEMKYDTQSVISPAVLASVAPFSEEDYDVLGLQRQNMEIAPVKKMSKPSKQIKEHVNVPPSLFWRRFTADTLSTKLKRLATHQKKIKTKDQFTPLLEQQPEGPEWSVNEDWILLKSINGVLEFPISLTISVPAQIPNWSIIADITSSLGRVRRSPLQCREHLMNIVIPREDGTVKIDDNTQEAKKHRSREFSLKKSKGRKEQRTKNLVINNSKEHTKQFTKGFDWIIQASINRRHTPKFTWDTVQKPSMHCDLLKDYGVQMETVQSPMQIAQLRNDRIQAEHPRHTPVQPFQPYHNLPTTVRPYSGSQFSKPSIADLSKLNYNVQRQGISSPLPSPQRSNSTVTFSPSKTNTVTTSVATSCVSSSSPVHLVSVSTSSAIMASKSYSTTTTSVGDISKTLSITRGLTSQQLLLLKQTATLHPQAVTTTTSTQNVQPHGSQSQSTVIQQKLTLPSGIEQLRATVASVLPRFAGISTTSGSTGKSLTSGRTLQTEEVLALLKQQSMRMAATKASHAASVAFNPGSIQLTGMKPQQTEMLPSHNVVGTKTVTTSAASSVAESFKAQIQALAAHQKAHSAKPLLSEKK